MYLPNKNELKTAQIRAFLQKMVLRRGMTKKISRLSSLISISSECADVVNLEGFMEHLLFCIFLNFAKAGKEFTFSLSGAGEGGVKTKSTAYIVTLAASMSDGALKVLINRNEIVLKFKGIPYLLEDIRKAGAEMLYCKQNGNCLVSIPIYSQ